MIATNKVKPRWIDIGVNLSNKQFKQDQAEILLQAQQAGVSQVVITGTDLEESKRAINLADAHNQLATVGIHPHDAKDNSAEIFEQIIELSKHCKAVAIGETGLDFNRNFSTPEDQINSFEKHIELAKASGKPMFLHERDAGTTMAEIIEKHRDNLSDIVIHCFTGSKEDLQRYLDLDLYDSYDGMLSPLHPWRDCASFC